MARDRRSGLSRCWAGRPITAAALAPFAAALIGSLVTWLLAMRRFSGKIETTEARDLWAESASIREWSRQRIEALERRVNDLELENAHLRAGLLE
jgi:hypothetical protein